MKRKIKELVLSRLLQWTSALLTRSGHSALAVQLDRASYALLPGTVPPYSYAHALWQEGQFPEAKTVLQKILAATSEHPEANNLLGVLYFNEEDMELADQHFRRAIQARPGWAAPNNNLGNVHRSRNEPDAAEQCYRTALDCDPAYVEALTNLGILLNHQGKNQDAETYCRKAVELAPGFAGAHCNLGNVMLSLGRLAEAVVAYNEALRLQPGIPEALANLPLILEDTGYLAGTIDYHKKQQVRSPGDYIPYVKIAQAMFVFKRWDDARHSLERALRLNPDAVDTLFCFSYYLLQIGDARGCIGALQKALASGPNAAAETGIIFNSMYLEEYSGEQLCAQYRDWSAKYASRPALPPRQHTSGPQGRLRIGYVSRDFCRHSVAYFLEPILRHHDRSGFEVFCYSTRHHEDDLTARFKSLTAGWRNISLIPEAEAVDLIRADGIDILVDLSGHTIGHRLGVFACKPAPVQVTYLGHPSTTGISAIDYRLGDAITDPPELTAAHYVEQLWHLPGCFLTYQPPEDAPQVAPPPVLEKGYVTFGSFNNVAKINDQVIAVWAEILAVVPASRLLLKGSAFASSYGRNRLLEGFARHGIGADRLELIEWRPEVTSHLELYAEIDIALDPFPYNGTTTTCEAIWMGLPVVCLRGERHSARVGASLLTAVGMERCVAQDPESYVHIAEELAADIGQLRQLRGTLRERMRRSALLDHAGFVGGLEQAYREMWREYCQRSKEHEAATGHDQSAVAPPDELLRLHIGGQESHPGWKILNIQARPGVDYLGDIRDLSQFSDHSFDEIYASHVLEHVAQSQVSGVLQGLFRILKSGGSLRLSVPDLEALCRLYIEYPHKPEIRVHVMRMMFGGQTDAHDYHQVGFDFEFLKAHLRSVGFERIDRVADFNIFADTSRYAPYGVPISLNVVAYRPKPIVISPTRSAEAVLTDT